MSITSSNVVVLSLTALFERFSYYGMRAIFILYATDATGLQLNTEEALSYMGIMVPLILILPLPLGILTDLVLKQKNAVIIGALISLIGYCIIMAKDLNIVIIGLVIIAVGSSLVKPNLAVLIGREFDKRDSKRVLGFIGLYTAVNIGAFFGIFLAGYLGEKHGWHYGFGLTAAATLVYLIFFLSFKNKFQAIEKNLDDTTPYNNPHYNGKEDILDDTFEGTTSQSKSISVKGFKPVPLFIITAIVASLYWILYQLGYDYYFMEMDTRDNLLLFGSPVKPTWSGVFTSYMTFGLGIALLIFWSIRKKVSSTFLSFSIALLMMAGSMLLFSGINLISDNFLILYTTIPLTAICIAELLVAPFAASYITRLANVRFSSTIYTGYFLISIVLGKAAGFLGDITNADYFILVLAAVALIVGVALLFFRKRLESMAGEIE